MDLYFWHIQTYYTATIKCLTQERFRHYVTEPVAIELVSRYPQFDWLLPELLKPNGACPLDRMRRQTHKRISGWGEAGSIAPDYECCLIRLISKNTDFLETLASYYDEISTEKDKQISQYLHAEPMSARRFSHRIRTFSREMASFLRSPTALSWPEPWSIPSKIELKQFGMNLSSNSDNIRKRIKFRFSAATAAIHFLRAMPDAVLAIRKVVLHE